MGCPTAFRPAQSILLGRLSANVPAIVRRFEDVDFWRGFTVGPEKGSYVRLVAAKYLVSRGQRSRAPPVRG